MLFVREFDDLHMRDNFRKLQEFLNGAPVLKGEFSFFNIVITGNRTLNYPHHLSFKPTDVIQTSVVFSAGAGTLTWNYGSFDSTNLVLTTTGMASTDTCTVRALVGRLS